MGGCCSKDSVVHAVEPIECRQQSIYDADVNLAPLLVSTAPACTSSNTVEALPYQAFATRLTNRPLDNTVDLFEIGHVRRCIGILLTVLLQGHRAAEQADGSGIQSVTASSVKVAVLVRPMLPFEQQKGGSSSVMVYPPDKVRPAAH
jgi:hypothetical protein